LRQLVRKGKAAGWKLTRARVLLKCDEGVGGPAWPDAKIAEALRIANRLEPVHTPRHGNFRGWLNIAECELSVLTRQCLGRRLTDTSIIAREAEAWAADRNASQTGVDWQFNTDNARTKLKRLYLKIEK